MIKGTRPYATNRIILHFGLLLATKLISLRVTIYFSLLFLLCLSAWRNECSDNGKWLQPSEMKTGAMLQKQLVL